MKSGYGRSRFVVAATIIASGFALAACGDPAMPRESRETIEAVCAGAPACIAELSERHGADEEVLVCTTISPVQTNPVLAFAGPASAPIGGACPDGQGLARAVIGNGALQAEERQLSELMRFLVWRASGLQTDRERLFAHLPEDLKAVAGGMPKYTGCIADAPVMDAARVVSKTAEPYSGGEQMRLDMVSRDRNGGKGEQMKGLYLTIGKDAAGRWVWYEPGFSCMPEF